MAMVGDPSVAQCSSSVEVAQTGHRRGMGPPGKRRNRCQQAPVWRGPCQFPALFWVEDDEPALALCSKASLLNRIAVGEKRGRLVATLMTEPPEPKPHGRRCARVEDD